MILLLMHLEATVDGTNAVDSRAACDDRLDLVSERGSRQANAPLARSDGDCVRMRREPAELGANPLDEHVVFDWVAMRQGRSRCDGPAGPVGCVDRGDARSCAELDGRMDELASNDATPSSP